MTKGNPFKQQRSEFFFFSRRPFNQFLDLHFTGIIVWFVKSQTATFQNCVFFASKKKQQMVENTIFF